MLRRSGVTLLVHDACAHGPLASGAGDRAGPRAAGPELIAIDDRSLPIRNDIAGSAGSGDAIGAIVFTSGTTGEPRAAMLTHGNLLASAGAWNGFLDAATDRPLAGRAAAVPCRGAGRGAPVRRAPARG